MAHWYFITEEMHTSHCASGIGRQLVLPTSLLFSPHFWTWACCRAQNVLTAAGWCWGKAVLCFFDCIILQHVSWWDRTLQVRQILQTLHYSPQMASTEHFAIATCPTASILSSGRALQCFPIIFHLLLGKVLKPLCNVKEPVLSHSTSRHLEDW